MSHTPFKLDTISAATFQGGANALHYAPYKGMIKDKSYYGKNLKEQRRKLLVERSWRHFMKSTWHC